MSDEQLHSLDEQQLVSEWKQDGEIISPEDQLKALNNLAEVKQSTDQDIATFNKLTPQTDEETGAARREELRQHIAEEVAHNE